MKKIETHIDEIVRLANVGNISKADIMEMLNISLEGEL